jgi:aspartyl-tRNA(Asn)/glutamyl-tRNA(Gln) amidotransferase subunit A
MSPSRRDISAADYISMLRDRAALVRAMDAQFSDVDGWVLPTVATVAPTMAEVSTRESFGPKTLRLARNTHLANFFDLCAISLPLPRASGLPVGLMLVARNGEDRKLFRMAAGIERVFAA